MKERISSMRLWEKSVIRKQSHLWFLEQTVEQPTQVHKVTLRSKLCCDHRDVDICRTKKLNYISVCLYDASKKALRIRIQTTYQRFMATVNSEVWCSSGRIQMIFLLSNRYPWAVVGDVHFLNNDLRKDTAAHASTVAIHYLQRFDNFQTVRHIL